MVKVSRKRSKRKSSSKVSKPGDLSLPKEKSTVSQNITDYSFLVYGEKKIGKTSLAARFPNAFHLFFEPGGKGQELYERNISNWEEFLGYIELLEKKEHNFQTVVLDTGGIAYDLCLDYVVRKNNIKHPGDMDDYGSSWKKVETEFKRAHNIIMNRLNLGIVVLAHSKTKEIESRTGRKFDKVVPNLSSQCMEYYTATMDNIILYNFIGNQRWLTIEGSSFEESGTRCEKNFKVGDENGPRVHRIPAGNNPDEAWENLNKAFNNNQKKTYEDVDKIQQKSTKSKKRSKRKKRKKRK